jgi:adenylate cyclase
VRIDRRGGNFVLEDLSSYGTWVRFAGSDSIIALRRQECTLSGNGEIALGASFDDFSAPCISFAIQDVAAKPG